MIRNALPTDAPQLSRLIVLAMGDLAGKFVSNPSDTIPLFEHFAQLPNNQYSYQNILVWDDGGVQGAICGYDGAKLVALRQPFLEYISSIYGVVVNPTDETQAGEYYIDCLAVFPEFRGKGISKKLIAGLTEYASVCGYDKLGLLVNQDNTSAKKLYHGLGFKVVDVRDFMGDVYEHLQLDYSTLLMP